MMRCPDCDSAGMFPETEGNGKCSACHGAGWSAFLVSVTEVMGGEPSECEECQGTGECQTCLGAGVLEESELHAAA
jgi:DnaJ-class molecular chaperone